MVQFTKGDVPLGSGSFDLAATIENTDRRSVLLDITPCILDCTDAGAFQH
jgi:hypothetical protein